MAGKIGGFLKDNILGLGEGSSIAIFFSFASLKGILSVPTPHLKIAPKIWKL